MRLNSLNPVTPLLASLALSVSLSAAPKKIPLDQLFPDKVVARGKGFEVKESEIDKAFLDFKAASAANRQPVTEADRPDLMKRLLDKQIFLKIMTQRATADDHAKGIERAEKLINRFREGTGSDAAFSRYLKSMGLEYDEFRTKFIDQAIVEEVLIRELHDQIPITDADQRRYYDENLDKFKQPEQLRAAHILIATRDLQTRRPFPAADKESRRIRIGTVRRRAILGSDFEKLAKEYSEDPGSKDRGGTYAFVKGQMAVEFETAAFALRIGEISDVVETSHGFHIIKLLDRKPAVTITFEQSKERIKSTLVNEKANVLMPKFTENLKQLYNVVVLDPKFNR
jgi:peptidyl-prolyl cis-trans isomerase C